MSKPEEQARQTIDAALAAAGWHVQDVDKANLDAGPGVAVREFSLGGGHGYADYLLYVGGKAAGVIEAKQAGTPLVGVEIQAEKYATGLPKALPAWRRPLPFLYLSTGVETLFSNGLDPAPRSRRVFHFHRPETLAEWLAYQGTVAQGTGATLHDAGSLSLRARLRDLPKLPLDERNLWPAQGVWIRY